VSGDGLAIEQLHISVESAPPGPVVHLAGELDPHTAPALEREVAGLMAAGATAVVLDLSQLQFIDSSGLRVLISAHRALSEQGGTLTLRSPSETAQRLLEITGLIDHIRVDGHGSDAGSDTEVDA